jgi:hypothetical protein
MTGDLYQLMVVVSAAPYAKHTNAMKAGLDTCAGVNLIRRNQVPYGSKIRLFQHGTSVKAAQGQKVSTVGEFTLPMKVSESPDAIAVDFVVVDALVVPALLGTPWIGRYVWSIDPPKRTVLLQFTDQKEPFRVSLTSAPKRLQHPLRVSSEQKHYLPFRKRG